MLLNQNLMNEKIFLKFIFENPTMFDFMQTDYFENEYIKDIYKISKKFFLKYHKIPETEQITQIIKSSENKNFIDDEGNYKEDVIQMIMSTRLNEYDQNWVRESFETWLKFKNLDMSILNLVTYIKSTKITEENINDVIHNSIDIIQKKNSIDLDFDEGSDFFNSQDHVSVKNIANPTGYNWLDRQLGGGWTQKQLVVFAGAPKSGKSQVLANLAVKAVENGLNCCIITLEMSEQIYIKRLAINYLDIDIDEYDDITNDSARLQQIIESKKVSNGNGLKVPGIFRIKEFPTGSASSLDIENYINKIQDKYDMKFNLIIIDYLNIMKNWRNPNTENLYLKIKQIAEDVRALSQRLETCIVTATQLNRAGSSTSNIQMTDVSESMGIVQTVDALFAILNRDDFDISNGTIRLKQLAVRNVPPDETPETFNLNQKHLRIEEMNNLNKNIFNRSDSENESQNNELWNF